MNRLEARIIKLEASHRNGWRAYATARVPMQHWPDSAFEGFLAESEGWPPEYEPTDVDLLAVVAAGGGADEDEEEGAA